jgi:hypothetical protein
MKKKRRKIMKQVRLLSVRYGLLGIVFILFVVFVVSATGAWGTTCIDVTKVCEDAGPDGVIHFSGTVTNCSTVGRDLTNVTVEDSKTGLVLSLASLAYAQSETYSGSYTPTESPSTNTVTATGTYRSETVTATDSATCETMEVGQCWLTAGGVKFSPLVGGNLAEYRGPKDNVGGNVYPGCSPDAGDGGSWTHIAHREKLHFHGTDITVFECGNVHGIEPGSESPVTPYNYIEFTGTGTLKGIHGNKDDYGTVCFFARAEDRNEPGNEKALGVDGGDDIDRYFLSVYECDDMDDELLLFDNGNREPETITGGNFQIHISSCDN